jgi:ATP-dependent Clp protease ATP-binding subunit ClpB
MSWPQRTFDPVIGRDEEIRRIMQVLSRRTKNNPVADRRAGVGKTAIVEGRPSASSTATYRKTLKIMRVIGLDIGALIAGAKLSRRIERTPEGCPERGDQCRR